MKEYRFKDNPEEQRIIEQFIEERGYIDSQLYNFIGNVIFNEPFETTDRDVQVFTGAIQWLGSPVGQSFLKRLGYELRTPQNYKEGDWVSMMFGYHQRTFYIGRVNEDGTIGICRHSWTPHNYEFVNPKSRKVSIIGHTKKRWWRQYLPSFIRKNIHPYPKP